jgi:hypothetical protein
MVGEGRIAGGGGGWQWRGGWWESRMVEEREVGEGGEDGGGGAKGGGEEGEGNRSRLKKLPSNLQCGKGGGVDPYLVDCNYHPAALTTYLPGNHFWLTVIQ